MTLAPRGWIAIGIVALVLILVLLTLGWCNNREQAQRAKAGETVAQGRTTSAVEAINEIGKLGERSVATDQQVREAQDAVRQADPSQRDAVARYQLCVLQQRTDCQRVQ